MSLNRFLPRNVKFYDATNPDEVLGGLVQNGSITEANFLDMLGILLVVGSPISVQERESSHILSRTEVPLQVGVYDIYCEASIQVSDESWVHRLISHGISRREDGFQIDIRNRDGKCVISGIPVPEIHIQSNNWTTFEAAHIINSRQNGFLLRQEVHTMFDRYLISVNLDDGYKVVVFDSDFYGYDGRTLDPVCRNPDDPHHTSDHLLRWHFRQSILEHDFSPGTDSVGEVLAGPYAPERFGLEIAAGLRVVS
ncbi:hypothetical protein HOY80DRAFT_1017240 [Tuber brumale]|nr:hypothetical protein HOY80DRAFT_1017240 [Tuber brumale]